jgi:hypothetical protein
MIISSGGKHMSHLSTNICREYFRLKKEMTDALAVYEAEPTPENKFAYRLLTLRWRDFCVETVAKYVGDDLTKEDYQWLM